jgi:hypothetical protein
MAKWALWAAHRYLEARVDGRRLGPDGRPLQRPWRVPKARVAELARQRRAERVGPRWSRPLGCCLMAVAAVAALDPDHPIPLHGAPTASAAPEPELRPPQGTFPRGECEGAPTLFTWEPGAVAPPFRVRLFAADYTEVGVVDDIGPAAWRPSLAVLAALGSGTDWHWTVESALPGQGRRSAFASFRIH